MAEGKPPYGDIHPMRAIFMIPTKPPPTFRDASKWSPKFTEFVNRYSDTIIEYSELDEISQVLS